MLRISRPGRRAMRRDLVYPAQILRRERNAHSAGILLKILPALSPRNRDDVFTLRKEPGQRKLARRALFFFRDVLDTRHEVEILLEVFSLETRRKSPVIVGGQVL